MGRGGRARRRAPPPEEMVPTGIAGIIAQGNDPVCGFCCCHAEGVTMRDKTMPIAFTNLYTQDEWTSLIRRLDEIYDSTICPPIPCMFTHFCIPFSPVCAIVYCASRRTNKIGEVIAQENARLGVQGLEWTLTPNRVRRQQMIMALRWTPARPAFEAANPQCRPVSREPLPVDFMSAELQAQLALAAMSPALIAAQGRQAAIALGMAPPPSAMEMAPPQQQTMDAAHGQSPQQQPQQSQQPSGSPAYGQPSYGQPSYAQPPVYGQQPPVAYGAPPSQQQQQPIVYRQPAYGQPSYGASGHDHPGAQHSQAHFGQQLPGVVPQTQMQMQPQSDTGYPASPSGLNTSAEGAPSLPAAAAAAAPASAPAPPSCPRCGVATADAGAAFCARCGTPIAVA